MNVKSNLSLIIERTSIVQKIKNREAFAIMIYHEWLKSDKDLCYKKYEVIDIQNYTFVTYKMKETDIKFFRENKHLFLKVIADGLGGIY